MKPWEDVKSTRLTRLQRRAVAWHTERFPDAQAHHVALKAAAELGEVAEALLGDCGVNVASGVGGDTPAEAADVVIALLVLVGRWHPDRDLLAEVQRKLTVLETPGAHAKSGRLPAEPAPQKGGVLR